MRDKERKKERKKEKRKEERKKEERTEGKYGRFAYREGNLHEMRMWERR